MSTYTRIVFLQGDEFDDWDIVYQDQGLEAALDYLTQWDMGEDDDVHDESAAGLYDDWHRRDLGDFEYLMTWDRYHAYASLERVVTS